MIILLYFLSDSGPSHITFIFDVLASVVWSSWSPLQVLVLHSASSLQVAAAVQVSGARLSVLTHGLRVGLSLFQLELYVGCLLATALLHRNLRVHLSA